MDARATVASARWTTLGTSSSGSHVAAREYGTRAWNYGENPPRNVRRARRSAAGEIDVRIDVQRGRVDALRVFGDFMGRREVGELESRLRGVR